MISKTAFIVKKDGSAYWNCYCTKPELIENYDLAIADTTQTWECHHRLEIMPWSGKQVSIDYLKEQGLYYNQPATTLVFLTPEQHDSLHKKGNKNPMYGKIRKHSTAAKQKMSESHKGKHWKLVDGKRVYY